MTGLHCVVVERVKEQGEPRMVFLLGAVVSISFSTLAIHSITKENNCLLATFVNKPDRLLMPGLSLDLPTGQTRAYQPLAHLPAILTTVGPLSCRRTCCKSEVSVNMTLVSPLLLN